MRNFATSLLPLLLIAGVTLLFGTGAVPHADYPNEDNPTGTPLGLDPFDQPIDVVIATWDVTPSSDMTADQAQAIALQHLISEAPDAPRWVVTWNGGATLIDLDRTSQVMQLKQLRDTAPVEMRRAQGTSGRVIMQPVSNEILTSTDWIVTEVHQGIAVADVQAVAAGRAAW